MNEQQFWATTAPKDGDSAGEQQALVEVKQSLPAEALNRFNRFLVEAQEKLPSSEQALATAEAFEVDSEVAFQVSDAAMSNLKGESKAFQGDRLGITRVIDDFKQQFLDAENAVQANLKRAIDCYASKMSAFRRAEREKAEKAQREAERLLAEQRAKQEAEARKLEEKAAKLKTPAAQQKALAEAESIRTVVALTPTSVALSAPAPQTVASNVAEIWEVKQRTDVSAYLRWLADHPEWQHIVKFSDAEEKRLAKQFHAIGVPGLEFHKRDSFRTKSR